MQLLKEQTIRQQMIMSALGFYKNKCDGIWGPASIAAKKAWELDSSFVPGIPNNGLPFGSMDYLPKGMTYDAKTKLFNHQKLSDEKIAELTDKQDVSKAVPVAVENVPVIPSPSAVAEDSNKEDSKDAVNGVSSEQINKSNTGPASRPHQMHSHGKKRR